MGCPCAKDGLRFQHGPARKAEMCCKSVERHDEGRSQQGRVEAQSKAGRKLKARLGGSSLEAKGQRVGRKQARVQGLVSVDGAAAAEARVRQAEGHAGGGIGGAPQLQAAGYGWGGGGRRLSACGHQRLARRRCAQHLPGRWASGQAGRCTSGLDSQGALQALVLQGMHQVPCMCLWAPHLDGLGGA